MLPRHPSSEPPPRPIQPGPEVSRFPHTSHAEATAPHPLAPPGGRTPETSPAEQEAGRRPKPRNSPSCLLVLVTSLLLAAIFASAGIGLVTVTAPSVLAPSRTSSGGTLPPTVADLQHQVIAVIHRVQPSVVEVEAGGTRGGAIGSGVIVTQDGYIVTNDHVVRGFERFTVTRSNGQTLPARLIGQAPQDDLAVLKIEATRLEPIVFGTAAEAQVGQFVIALGSPFGLERSATFGIISALQRTASGPSNGSTPRLSNLIQTSAPINPGNSGGALVDLQGRLIGIPTLGAMSAETGAANGIGFALPSDRVQSVTERLIQESKAS